MRAHSEAVLSGNMDKYHAHKSAPALRDHGPGPAVAALMKLSFEEEHKNTITELGGLQVSLRGLQGSFGGSFCLCICLVDVIMIFEEDCMVIWYLINALHTRF